jgi:hypothetical protein
MVTIVLGAVAVTGLAATAQGHARASNVLTLPPEFEKTAPQLTQVPRDCSRLPGGPMPDVDGWVFNQPIAGAARPVYEFGFVVIKIRGGIVKDVVGIRIDEHGVSVIPAPSRDPSPTAGPTLTPSSAPSSSPSPERTLSPLPPNVTGGLLNGGAGGAWLRTPAGSAGTSVGTWLLYLGRLTLDASSTTATSFAVVSVCLPDTPVANLPSAGPGHADTGQLPTTGNNAGPIVAVGLLTIVAGVVTRWLYRRHRFAVDGPEEG